MATLKSNNYMYIVHLRGPRPPYSFSRGPLLALESTHFQQFCHSLIVNFQKINLQRAITPFQRKIWLIV